MKALFSTIILSICFQNLIGQNALELEALSEGSSQLKFVSVTGQAFEFRVNNDGTLRIIANENDEVMQIDDDTKNVGIGTANPLHKLHVSGNRLRISSPTNEGKFIDFRTDGAALDVASTGGKLFLLGNDGEGVIIQQFAGNVAIGNDDTPDAKLDVVGSIHYTGTITDVSDIRLKEKMVPLENSLDKISRLNGFVYNLIGETERNTGVSAQDVQKVLPEAVTEIDDGYLGVDYTQIIPLLIEGIKEQQLEIIALKHEMSEMRKLLNSQAGRSVN